MSPSERSCIWLGAILSPGRAVGEALLGVLVDERLEMTWQFSRAAQKAGHILGCIKSHMTSRVREGTPLIYSTLMRS